MKENLLPKTNEKQIARIESKVNYIQKMVLQIHRMMISSATGSESHRTENVTELNNLPELPLHSVESLNKFERDLDTPSYRKKVVSMNQFIIFISISYLC